jgi:hypothetical protein
MGQSNETIYQLLTNQIQTLLNEEFIRELELGKYSKWAIELTSSEIISILSAIGEYGKLGNTCPDIDTSPMFSGSGLDRILGNKLWLTRGQLSALSFLSALYGCSSNPSKLTIPFEYSKRSPYFLENVVWARELSSSDLFGILWHVGGFSVRNFYKNNLQSCINDYHPRTQECLICLMRVAQGQKTYYQLAGKRYSLRENPPS